jgi:hypothetical protein
MMQFGVVMRNAPPPQGPDEAEALEWLRGNANKSAFATNRFQGTGNAIKFVEALYAAGAPAVLVQNIQYDLGEAGPYSDSMRVELPAAADGRRAVLAVINDIGRPETADGQPVSDDGEGQVSLWWD